MKIFTKSTSKLLVLTLLISQVAWAKSVGRVTEVKGHVFTLSQGETKILKAGDEINDLSELITEEGSQITFNDFHDHVFHLSGSGQISLAENKFDLKRGYLWVQSYNSYVPSKLNTANSSVEYKKGDFILSFDISTGRTQVLAVSGELEFMNLHEAHMKRKLDAGQFSFVDLEYEAGMPRLPTMIGYKSYSKITTLFDGIKPLDASMVAVIENKKEVEGAKKVDRKTAGMFDQVMPKKAKNKEKIQDSKAFDVKVYGLESEMMETLTPALPSVQTKKREPASAPVEVQKQFEASLEKEIKAQPKHSSEVNHLIDELKSFQSDYQKEY